jgi:hypothetical protein
MSGTGYDDLIRGVVVDEQDRRFFVFMRVPTGTYKFFHILAQASSGEVFIIQKAEIKGIVKRDFVVTMQDADGASHFITVKEIREAKEGLIGTAFAVATTRTETIGRDSLRQDWWRPLDRDSILEWRIPEGQ